MNKQNPSYLLYFIFIIENPPGMAVWLAVPGG